MTMDTSELEFMGNLLAGLDASHFSVPPSQSPPKARISASPARHRRTSKHNDASDPLSSSVSSKQLKTSVSAPNSGSHIVSGGFNIDDLLDWSHFPSYTPPVVKRADNHRHVSSSSQKRLKCEPPSPPSEAHSTNLPSIKASSSAAESQIHREYTRCCVVGVLDRTYSAVSARGTRVAPERALLLRVESRDQLEAPVRTILALLHDEWNQTQVECDDMVHLVGSFEKDMHPVPQPFHALSDDLHTFLPTRSPKLEVSIHTGPNTPSTNSKMDLEDDLWNDMGSLPSLSQYASQDTSAGSSSTVLIKTMIFGSRSHSSDAASVEHINEGDPRDNLLIVHPDVLVPATKVADVATCIRKPIIQDRLRGGSDLSVPLVMGNMLHEVLQACLTGIDQSTDSPEAGVVCLSVKSEFGEMVSVWPETWIGIGNFSRHFVERQINVQVCANIESLYAIGIDLSEAADRLREKAAPFAQFAKVFLARHNDTFHPEATVKDCRIQDGAQRKSPTRVRLTRILDVEEEIWSPMYGLKGKVDVSVECEILESSPASLSADSRPFSKAGAAQQSKEPCLLRSVLPLELKTGRAEVVSTEHRAQTMLYSLMMSDRYGTLVSDGLLYYSRSGDLHRISRSRNEVRSLIIGRNELAHYLRRDSKQLPQHTILKATQTLLPPTIDNEHKCGRCYAVDGCMLYRNAVENVKEPKVEPPLELPLADIEGQFPSRVKPKRSAIADLFVSKTGHLTQSHSDFFQKWEMLLSLEEDDAVRIRREMWNMKAEERERLGRCFANMRLEVNPQDNPDHYFPKSDPDNSGSDAKLSSILPARASLSKGMHKASRRFVRHAVPSNEDGASILSGHMAINDPVTISIEPGMLSVAQGFITGLTPTAIDIGIDHDLQASLQRVWEERGITPSLEAVGEIVFRIDKDELSSGLGRVRSNLANLFLSEDRGGDTKRRELIVDLRAPRFLSPQEMVETYPTEPHSLSVSGQITADSSLNQDQKVAIDKVLSAKDYALILGMPGTGKTTTIAKLIQLLTRMGKRILLTSYTHSAVDTILRKLGSDLNSDVHILRLGNKDKIHPDAHRFLLPRCSTLEELKDAYERPNVVAATCLSIHHSFFTSKMSKSRKSEAGGSPSFMFDYCIVDEASQIPLPTCLGPLRFAEKFVLVGDHHQLPPLVKNPRAREGGLDVSLFKLLSDKYGQEAMVYLKSQYRMNSDIMHLSNTLIYHGALHAGSEAVGRQTLRLDNVNGALANLTKLSLPSSLPETSSSRTLTQDWVRDALDPQSTVRFFDTSLLPLNIVKESKSGEIVKNPFEARAVIHLATALVLAGCKPENIAVLTPYRQQIKLLQSMLHSADAPPTQNGQKVDGLQQIELLTADQSQGRDKDVIIVTLSRASAGPAAIDTSGSSAVDSSSGTGELLNDLRRLNVTLTRARRKLLLVGHAQTLQSSSILKSLLELLKDKGWIHALKSEIVQQAETAAETEADFTPDDLKPQSQLEAAEQLAPGQKKTVQKSLRSYFIAPISGKTRPVLQDVQAQRDSSIIKARRLH